MDFKVFDLKIIEKVEDGYRLKIYDKESRTFFVIFNPENKYLCFLEDNKLAAFFMENEYQFRKLLHNKRPDTFFPGFQLRFVLQNAKDVAAFNDRSRVIALDRRGDRNECFVVKEREENIVLLFTDGCYLEKKKQGAISVVMKDLKGDYTHISETIEEKNSCLCELKAIMKALELTQDIDKIRISTDSQYVRKGLTEWIYYWKLNNWYTVNGEKVKHIQYWQSCDKFLQGRYVELAWIKSHSEHFENSLCDILAREKANA